MLEIDNVFLHPQTREDFLPGFYEYWIHNNNGYHVLDLELGYQFRKIQISLVSKNIFNKEYMGRPGDIQPPRNYSIKMSHRF